MRTLWNKIAKIFLWIIFSIVLIVIVLPFSLYIPIVQDLARQTAIEYVNKSTELKININRIRFSFPLKIQVEGLNVAYSTGDTMLAATSANANVAIFPLLHKNITISSFDVRDALYKLGTPDSALFLTARISKINAQNSDIPFSFNRIRLNEAYIDDADINLVINDTVTVADKKPTESTPFIIEATTLNLSNVRYKMSLLPTIDSLGVDIPTAKLQQGKIDLNKQLINADLLSADSISASYITPNYIARTSEANEDSSSNQKPWLIKANKIKLTARNALYATKGIKPTAGFDPQHIQASNLTMQIDSFYNEGTSICLPISNFSATERCGITLTASGVFDMDSTSMSARNFNILTTRSNLYIDATMGTGNINLTAIPLSLKANGTLSLLDAQHLAPALSSFISALPASSGLEIVANAHGSSNSMNIETLHLNLPGYIMLNAHGNIDKPFDYNKMSGLITFNGKWNDLNKLRHTLINAPAASQFNIPSSTINGCISYAPGNIGGDVKMHTSQGLLALDGQWNQNAERYNANLSVNRFPINAFMPSLGIGEVTADALISGKGYNPSKPLTQTKADINLKNLALNGEELNNITIATTVDSCRLAAFVTSENRYLNLDADIDASYNEGAYQWDFSSDIRHINLEALKLSENTLGGTAKLMANGAFNPSTFDILANLNINNLSVDMDSIQINVENLDGYIMSTDSLTQATIKSGDLNAEMTAFSHIKNVIQQANYAWEIAYKQIENRSINIDSIQQALPHVTLYCDMGTKNPIAPLLISQSDITFKRSSLQFSNDSLISLRADIENLKTKSTKVDYLSLDANQHGKYLIYTAQINNQPGTLDNFANVSLNGFIADDKISAMLKQSNIKNEQGFHIGFNANVSDCTVTMRLVPYSPIIAYKKWNINKDNSLSYNFITKHFDSNVELMSDSSAVRIFTEHCELTDSLVASNPQEDIILQLNNIRLQDWLSISPFAPPVMANLNADMRFRLESDEITGKGVLEARDLYYGGERVGSFDLNLNIANENRTKSLHADVDLLIDGHKVITATGALNDSTAVNPFLLDFNMIHFPLHVLNPFLPKDLAQLKGALNGKMDITGSMSEPIFNGYLNFDSTAVAMKMTGASYQFSDTKIPVDSNIVKFNDYIISGLNKNNLHIDGYVDARKLTNVNFNLDMIGNDIQVVNSNRPRNGADIYGKAFMDVNATARGNLNFVNINADLNVLPGTNVTYVIPDAESTLSPQTSAAEMVTFVNFADSAKMAAVDSLKYTEMAMILNANLTISDGSTINVDLSPDGKNKASIQGSGSFDYLLTPMNGDGRLTGRFTINDGFVRYTPSLQTGGLSMAIMSEKNFKFQEGSYVSFTGDMFNPNINIKATDQLKANVTPEGQNSRLVTFDVEVSLTNTLNNLNVAFNLSTDDDITVQNELASMSPEQRANQAMNMLLYNMYTGLGSKANANLSGNPLYSFLASQLNTWAASNIKSVDITFGIDQYDTTTDGTKSTTTNYSYKVSKTLFNDRFKIIVGGNYSTDADTDENLYQNLINDIAFEYMINRSGTMYVRLFRHIGYESILEGEITQTGVGFVVKRKINSLRDLPVATKIRKLIGKPQKNAASSALEK